VFFGASGDLAYKRIFSALQAMARRGRPDCRIIGVAKSGWTLLNSYSASVTENGGGEDPEVFARLVSQLRYVDGDYGDTDTFARLRAELQGCSQPAHYLAIPPSMFRPVVGQLAKANCTNDASSVQSTRTSRGVRS
jgi:glucose-6-phosphate 1-dehydrogenase